jgi:hypothetical protein
MGLGRLRGGENSEKEWMRRGRKSSWRENNGLYHWKRR